MRITACSVLGLLIVLGGAFAQQKSTGDEAALKAIELKWDAANVKGDTATLTTIFADTFISTNAEGKTRTKAEVLAEVRSGDIKGAIETANLNSRLVLRVKRLVSIAVIRHLAGKDDGQEIFDRAVAVVKESNEKEGPIIASAQGYIAQALAQMGRFPEAFQLASKITEPLQHAAHGIIAIEQAKAKDIDGALKIARSIPAEHAYFRDQTLKDIAAVQPDADVLATLKEVHYDYFRAAGLVELAKRQVAAKRRQQAEETFRIASEAAHRTVDPPEAA